MTTLRALLNVCASLFRATSVTHAPRYQCKVTLKLPQEWWLCNHILCIDESKLVGHMLLWSLTVGDEKVFLTCVDYTAYCAQTE
jgi:hypothetical protein